MAKVVYALYEVAFHSDHDTDQVAEAIRAALEPFAESSGSVSGSVEVDLVADMEPFDG